MKTATTAAVASLAAALVLTTGEAGHAAEEPSAPTEPATEARAETGGAEEPPPPSPPVKADTAATLTAAPATPDNRPWPPPPPGQGPYPAFESAPAQRPSALGPPPRGAFRPFTFSLGLGPGLLALHDTYGRDAEAGFSYLLRFGFALAARFHLNVSFEGATATRPDEYAGTGDAQFDQQAFLIGLQYFIFDWLSVRGGFGFADVSVDSGYERQENGGGYAFSFGLGAELVTFDNFALTAEATTTVAQYPRYDEAWEMSSLNLVLSFF